MVDFLNLSENKSNCECLKLGYSMQLLPNQVDPYVLYIGEQGDYSFLISIELINIYGEVVLLPNQSGEHDNYISLKNLQYNDNNPIIFKLTLAHGVSLEEKVLYSDPLLISSKNACKTTRIHFKCAENDVMQSIQAPIYYVQDKRSTELENYYNIGNKTSISYATSNAKYQVYKSKFMSIDAINKLNDALISPFVYFNKKRMNLFEAIEIPDMQADERFGETTILMSKYIGINDEDLTDEIFVLGSRLEDDIIQDGNINIIATDGY